MLERVGEFRSRITARVDGFISVKKAYMVWKHLVPFAVASLLLLMLSLPGLKLFFKFSDLLDRRGLLWAPAGILTVAAAVVYFQTIKSQIYRAYLWDNRDRVRTLCTSLAYVILCTLMAYGVARSVSPVEPTTGNIWASLLVALLSLTGIGWKGPSSWVESAGIKSPDYTDARSNAAKITKILKRVRGERASTERDVEDFLKAAESLQAEIEKNIEFEPPWMKCALQEASESVLRMAGKVRALFPLDDASAVQDFADACRYYSETQYGEFIESLRALGNRWDEWRYSSDRAGGGAT